MLKLPNCIIVGAAGRNAGKTELAAALIAHLRRRSSVYALKVTSVERQNGACPRGGAGCGACALAGADFVLSEERDTRSGKDTARLAAAGAAKVFWLRSLRSALEAGMAAFLERIPAGALIVGESNALRGVVTPGLFIMLNNADGAVKPSAARVAAQSDLSFNYPWTEENLLSALKMSEKLFDDDA